MMFEDRMKQIEDDIVPFGFVDDGSEWLTQQENTYEGWHHINTLPEDKW